MKKPMFKARIGWALGTMVSTSANYTPTNIHQRVRVTDARELTAEQAVQRVIQYLHDCEQEGHGLSSYHFNFCAAVAGMTATVKNGKVIVKKARKCSAK